MSLSLSLSFVRVSLFSLFLPPSVSLPPSLSYLSWSFFLFQGIQAIYGKPLVQTVDEVAELHESAILLKSTRDAQRYCMGAEQQLCSKKVGSYFSQCLFAAASTISFSFSFSFSFSSLRDTAWAPNSNFAAKTSDCFSLYVYFYFS